MKCQVIHFTRLKLRVQTLAKSRVHDDDVCYIKISFKILIDKNWICWLDRKLLLLLFRNFYEALESFVYERKCDESESRVGNEICLNKTEIHWTRKVLVEKGFWNVRMRLCENYVISMLEFWNHKTYKIWKTKFVTQLTINPTPKISKDWDDSSELALFEMKSELIIASKLLSNKP